MWMERCLWRRKSERGKCGEGDGGRLGSCSKTDACWIHGQIADS